MEMNGGNYDCPRLVLGGLSKTGLTIGEKGKYKVATSCNVRGIKLLADIMSKRVDQKSK